MTRQYRKYQTDAVPELRAAIERSHSVVYVLPTGGGKTLVAGDLAKLAAENGGKTLLLVHRRELVAQAVDTLASACPDLSIGVEANGWPSQPWAHLQVGMVQSIVRRKHVVTPNLVIVDEAHHARAATWERVLARWPDAARVGLTATPQRLDGKGLRSHFAEMVLGPSIPDLIASDYLAPTRTLRLPEELLMNLEDVKMNRHGDYQGKDLRRRVTDKVIADAAQSYLRYAQGRSAIFFGITTDHSKAVIARLRDSGVRAEHVDGTDSHNRRDRIMNALRDGGVDVVGNCDLISEGFDAPRCDCVMLGAPTRSITRYLQAAGRAMRPEPGKVALILDLTGISHHLGLPDEVRNWSLDDGWIPEARGTAGGLRRCKSCSQVAYKVPCPHCGFAQEAPVVDELDTELEDAKTPSKRKPRMKQAELWKLIHAARKAPDPRLAVEEIARDAGYKLGWVNHILRVYGIK